MNVLFLSRLFYPHRGGVEKHVWELSKILIKKGYKIIIVTEKFKSGLKDKEELDGIEIYRIPAGKSEWLKKFYIWFWLCKHKYLIIKADIVHCHDVFFWYLPFRFLYLKKSVFTTFHGYESYPLKLKSIILHKISEKLSKGNICIGDYIKKWYGTKPDYVTYGGVEISNLMRQLTDQISNVTIKESALFIGRLDEQTGIFTYAKAVEIIRKKIPVFNFTVIGDGKFKSQINKNIKVLGALGNPEKYFQNFRFAFVSRYLSMLEAMLAKKLIFAVYDNSLKEDYLKMSPFAKFINIVSSKDELAEKILYFLKNPRKEKIIVNKAFKWAKEQSFENVAQLYLLLWKRSFDQI